MKRKFFTSLAAAGLLACTVITASAAQPARDTRPCRYSWQCPGTSKPGPDTVPGQETAAMSALEAEACRLVNQQRAAKGLASLTIDSNLSVKARIKARDMRDNGYFSHTSPTYGSPFAMMNALGISYRSAGENIAKGYTSAKAVVDAWMASQSHRDQILSAKYSSMGIGYVDGYWTLWLIG